MRQTIPTFSPKKSTVATAVQPDYRKWEAVRPGMTRAEVTELLGPPLTGRERRPILYFFSGNVAYYGFISYPASRNWLMMSFTLAFDDGGRVSYKTDPFGGGTLSRTGKPSKPKIIIPQTGTRFSHIPRLVDARWYPCSGVYPLVYEMEVGLAVPGSREYSDHREAQQLGQPYGLIHFPGSQPGRVRVRGRNERGVGPWSEYTEFTFEVPRPQ